MLARAGLGRLTPRGMWLAVLASNAPDLDVISLAGGTTTYFEYHRWATHAILFIPLMALVPVLLVSAIFRQRLPWVRAWVVCVVAIATHLLLDFTNPYGIRLFLPFSNAWPSLDITQVVDVWIWAILLIGLLWPILSGLVSSEIGDKKRSGAGMAVFILFLLALYDTGRFFLHERAIDTLRSRVYEGAAPRQVVAFPHSANPMVWDGWVEGERSWMKLNVDLTQEFDPKPVATYWQAEPEALLQAARKVREFQVLLPFAKTPYWRVSVTEEPAGAKKVELIDLRFGRGDRLGFTATAVFDANGRPVQSWLGF